MFVFLIDFYRESGGRQKREEGREKEREKHESVASLTGSVAWSLLMHMGQCSNQPNRLARPVPTFETTHTFYKERLV